MVSTIKSYLQHIPHREHPLPVHVRAPTPAGHSDGLVIALLPVPAVALALHAGVHLGDGEEEPGGAEDADPARHEEREGEAAEGVQVGAQGGAWKNEMKELIEDVNGENLESYQNLILQ